LEVYLKNSRGTRKLAVMSFCSTQYTDMIIKIYPELKPVTHQILTYVEHKVIQETLKYEDQRLFLQKTGALKMKLQTIENTIHRLTEEINARKQQAELSDAWYTLRGNMLERLGVYMSKSINEKWSNIRQMFIVSAENSLKQEVAQFREFDNQLRALVNKSKTVNL
jgi:hypothetical protein